MKLGYLRHDRFNEPEQTCMYCGSFRQVKGICATGVGPSARGGPAYRIVHTGSTSWTAVHCDIMAVLAYSGRCIPHPCNGCKCRLPSGLWTWVEIAEALQSLIVKGLASIAGALWGSPGCA